MNNTRRITDRPIFVLALRAEKGTDGVRALRRALKVLKRYCGLKCVSIREASNGRRR
jgi:hypothetical protein